MPRKPNLPKGDPEWHREWLYQKANGEDKKQKERGKARAMYDKAGIDRKGKQIDHIKKVEDGGASTMANTRLRSIKANEGDNKHNPGEKKGKK